jgi:hypothetical protein
VVFWVMTACSLVGWYRHFKTTHCHNPEDRSILRLLDAMLTTEHESKYNGAQAMLNVMLVFTPREHQSELCPNSENIILIYFWHTSTSRYVYKICTGILNNG